MQFQLSIYYINDKISKNYMKKYLVILLFTTILLQNCDRCNITNNTEGNPENKIYFSAISSNTGQPSIFSIQSNLTSTRELIPNGVIFSAPSDNGLLAFTKLNNDGINELYLYNLLDKNSTFITKESNIFAIRNPILSQDASKICFDASDNQLVIYNNDNTNTFELISSNIADNSDFNFSPNSKYLTFIEKINNNNYKIKIIDAQNIKSINTIFETNEEINLNLNNINNFFSWNKNSEILTYTINTIDSTSIIIIDTKELKQHKISFSSKEFRINNLSISPNNEYAAFTNSDGNIWIIKLKEQDYKFFRITNFNDGSICFAPNWSNDGTKIIFLLKNNDNNSLYNTLLIADINFNISVSTKQINLISNNVFRGYIKF